MTTLHSIEQDVRNMLAEEHSAMERARQNLRSSRARHHSPPDQPCPATWVLSQLIDQIVDHPSRPVSDLHGTIRCRVKESCFIAEAGDCCASPEDYDEMIETQVKVISRVLERVRQRLLKS